MLCLIHLLESHTGIQIILAIHMLDVVIREELGIYRHVLKLNIFVKKIYKICFPTECELQFELMAIINDN